MAKGTELAIPEDLENRLAKLGQGPLGAMDATTAGRTMSHQPPRYFVEHLMGPGAAERTEAGLKKGLLTLPTADGFEQAKRVRAVLLHHSRGRLCYAEKYAEGQRPLCVSNNFVRPLPGGSYPGPCPPCPQAVWGATPRCVPTYNLILFDLEREVPFTLLVKKAGDKCYETYYDQKLPLKAREVIHTGLEKAVNCCVETIVLPKMLTGSAGPYWVADFVVGEQIPLEQAQLMAVLMLDLQVTFAHLDTGAAAGFVEPEADPDADDLPF